MDSDNNNLNQERRWLVYIHRNKINGKRYVGITSNLKLRWRGNGNAYRTQSRFWRAIKKYGWDNFEHIIVLQDVTFEYACLVEKYLIRHYKTKNDKYGYNLTDGGEGTWGWTPTNETRQKMRESHIGKQLSEEQKKLLSEIKIGKNNPYYGKKHSEKTRKKMSESGKGRPKTENFKEFMSEKMTGSKNPMAKFPVYCVNTNEIFWGAKAGSQQYPTTDPSRITACCRGKKKSAGKHPITGEKLRWLYVEDQSTKDGLLISGAISLGYIT